MTIYITLYILHIYRHTHTYVYINESLYTHTHTHKNKLDKHLNDFLQSTMIKCKYNLITNNQTGYDPSLLINIHSDFGMHIQNVKPTQFKWFILYEHYQIRKKLPTMVYNGLNCVPSHSYVEDLTSNMTIYGDRILKEVLIK